MSHPTSKDQHANGSSYTSNFSDEAELSCHHKIDSPGPRLPVELVLEIFLYVQEGIFPSCSLCRNKALFSYAKSCRLLNAPATKALYTTLDLSGSNRVEGEEIDAQLKSDGLLLCRVFGGKVWAGRKLSCPVDHTRKPDFAWTILNSAYNTLVARPDLAEQVRHLKLPSIAKCFSIYQAQRNMDMCWKLLDKFMGVLIRCPRLEMVTGLESIWEYRIGHGGDFLRPALRSFQSHFWTVIKGHKHWTRWDWSPFLIKDCSSTHVNIPAPPLSCEHTNLQ